MLFQLRGKSGFSRFPPKKFYNIDYTAVVVAQRAEELFPSPKIHSSNAVISDFYYLHWKDKNKAIERPVDQDTRISWFKCNFPYLFDCGAYPVAHLLLLKSSMPRLLLSGSWQHKKGKEGRRTEPMISPSSLQMSMTRKQLFSKWVGAIEIVVYT